MKTLDMAWNMLAQMREVLSPSGEINGTDALRMPCYG